MKRRILHVADVHLDSPLHGLSRTDPTIAERMQKASRESFTEVVSQALHHEVAVVVIAGDLFDGPIRDAGAALWVEKQFQRLESAGIRVAMILGNHDAQSGARRVMNWPANVYQFGSDAPSTMMLEDHGLAIHGQSFGARAETEDLASKYPTSQSGYVNVGVLHTSLSGSGSHDSYAPTSVKVLEGMGYDYWALGHIHARSPESLSERCFVGYSGNTQGRHIREPGAKGCWLTEFTDNQLSSMKFLATDQFRWHELNLDIGEAEHLRDIDELIGQHVDALHDIADGRPLAVRLVLRGETRLHGELSRPSNQAAVTQSVSQRLEDIGEMWLETVKVRSAPFIDRTTQDILEPIQYLSRVAERGKSDPHTQAELQTILEELFKNARHELNEAGWEGISEQDAASDSALLHHLQMAENMLVSRLMEGADR